MRIKSQKDFWSGVMFVAVGMGFAWGATYYNFGTSARPGPGYFPFGLSVLLTLLGALVLFKALTIESEGGDPIGDVAWRPLFWIVLSIVIGALALPRLGLIITLPLLICISSLAGDEFHWLEAVIMSVALTLVSWLVFIKGLNLTIPIWPTIFATTAT